MCYKVVVTRVLLVVSVWSRGVIEGRRTWWCCQLATEGLRHSCTQPGPGYGLPPDPLASPACAPSLATATAFGPPPCVKIAFLSAYCCVHTHPAPISHSSTHTHSHSHSHSRYFHNTNLSLIIWPSIVSIRQFLIIPVSTSGVCRVCRS